MCSESLFRFARAVWEHVCPCRRYRRKTRSVNGKMQDSTIAVLPTGCVSSTARCLMFYDWEKELSSDWLDVIEEVFAEFGVEPSEGTGDLGQKHSHGKYSRVRARLRQFLDGRGDRGIRVRSAPTSDEAFFPGDICVDMDADAALNLRGVIAVKETVVDSCDELAARVMEEVNRVSGAMYATVFDFPSAFGPDCYLATATAVPTDDLSVNANEEYSARLRRWRNAARHGLRPAMGYQRGLPDQFRSGRPFERRIPRRSLRRLHEGSWTSRSIGIQRPRSSLGCSVRSFGIRASRARDEWLGTLINCCSPVRAGTLVKPGQTE